MDILPLDSIRSAILIPFFGINAETPSSLILYFLRTSSSLATMLPAGRLSGIFYRKSMKLALFPPRGYVVHRIHGSMAPSDSLPAARHFTFGAYRSAVYEKKLR
jgi:hypothetical protein